MSNSIFYAIKSTKSIVVFNKKSLESYIQDLPEGTELEIKIHKVSDYRTAKQNKLYWKCLRTIAKAYGEHEVEVFHSYFKDKKLCYTILLNKEEVRHCKSTADLTISEFSEYIEFIAKWAAENLQISILSTDEKMFLTSVKSET
jgi:hypothetical protein